VGGGAPGGGPSEIRFVKPEDEASLALARLCVSAAVLPGARFDFLRVTPDGAWVKCYEIELEDVTVAYVATAPRREAGQMETVVLTFAHARLTAAEGGTEPPDGAG
jgi:type VI protein secretion system component Hcp